MRRGVQVTGFRSTSTLFFFIIVIVIVIGNNGIYLHGNLLCV